MTHYYCKTFLLSFALLFFSNLAFTQSYSKKEIYAAYDRIVGKQNTDIYNGIEFKDPYLNTDGTFRYFNSFNFTLGEIVYQGNYYSDMPLKYDLLEDKLIVQPVSEWKTFLVELFPEQVESFTIDNHQFINLKDTGLDFSGNYFFEIAYKGENFELFIKHTKKIHSKAVGQLVEYRFTKDSEYILKVDTDYYKIDSKKDFRDIFPEQYKSIRNFYGEEKDLLKQDETAFLKKLVEKIETNQLL